MRRDYPTRTLCAYRSDGTQGWSLWEGETTPFGLKEALAQGGIRPAELRIIASGEWWYAPGYDAVPGMAMRHGWFPDRAARCWRAPGERVSDLPLPPAQPTHVTIYVDYILYGYLSLKFLMDGFSIDLVCSEPAIDLVGLILLMHGLPRQQSGHVLLGRWGEEVELHARFDSVPGSLHLVARSVHAPDVVALNIVLDDEGPLSLKSAVLGLAHSPQFARNFLCHVTINEEQSEKAYLLAEQDWESGVQTGRYDPNDFELSQRLDAWITVREVPLSDSERGYLELWQRFMQTGALPAELGIRD